MWISHISSSVLNIRLERITPYTGNLCHKYTPADDFQMWSGCISVVFSHIF